MWIADGVCSEIPFDRQCVAWLAALSPPHPQADDVLEWVRGEPAHGVAIVYMTWRSHRCVPQAKDATKRKRQ